MAVAAPDTTKNPTKNPRRKVRPVDLAGGPTPVGTGDLRAALATVASFVSSFEPGLYSGEDATVLVRWFTRAERVAGAGKALAARRASAAHPPARTGHRSPAEWLAEETGESVGEAAGVLRLGEACASHPGVEDSYRSGKLSKSKATLVADALTVNPDVEDDLVRSAETESVRHLRDRCLRAKAEGRSRQDEARAYEALRAARHCKTWTDPDGAFRLDARLTPDAGASLLASLKRETDRYFRQARTAGVREPEHCYRADALVGLVTGRGLLTIRPGTTKSRPGTTTSRPGTTTSGAGTLFDPPGSDSDPGSASDPDCDSEPGPDCRSVDPQATVHVRVDLDALRRGSLDRGEVCEIPGVGPIPVERARALLGDALCDLVITNGVDVTTICHLGRSIPTALTTAVSERDRQCVVPGCPVTEGLEQDHWQVDFAHGGPASIENIARLCHHHHYLRTHQGFQLHGGPGHWTWEPPTHPKSRPKRSKAQKTKAQKTQARRRPPPGTAPPLFTPKE